MTWNWQKSDWPNFRWDRARLDAAEKQFLLGGGVFFKGGLSAGKYSTITGASPATTTRDLADEKGALVREGERRYARYRLCIPACPVRHVVLTDHGELAEN